MSGFESQLKELKSQGFLLLKNALEFEHVIRWREILYGMYENGRYEVHNSVGNVAFEKLLALQPELSRDLIGHDSVAPFLKFILGKQCQLRSLRAHVNPQSYLQEWHMDFYDYWYQQESSKANVPLKGLCMNTTFYNLFDHQPRQKTTFQNAGRLVDVTVSVLETICQTRLAQHGQSPCRAPSIPVGSLLKTLRILLYQ